jgi:ABC-type transport system involved in multi-copper enzyme maturation permease subunit
MRQLLWKEWHEQSWKLAFGSIVLTAIAVIGLHSRMIPDATLIQWICLLGATMLPVLSSTGLVPAERAEGTLESLLAIPVAPWRILLVKTFVGLLLCVGPMLITAIVSVWMVGGRESLTFDILEQYGRSTLTSVCLFMWMMALTIRLPSEARAATLAVGLLVFWGIASGGLALSPLRSNLFAVSPAVFLLPKVPVISQAAMNDQLMTEIDATLHYEQFKRVQFAYGPSLLVCAAVQLVVLSLLWLLSVRLFVRVEDQS